MNIIDQKSNKVWWNNLLREISRFADHKWLNVIEYLISHNCVTDDGTPITQSLIAEVSGVDPSDLSVKLQERRKND